MSCDLKFYSISYSISISFYSNVKKHPNIYGIRVVKEEMTIYICKRYASFWDFFDRIFGLDDRKRTCNVFEYNLHFLKVISFTV